MTLKDALEIQLAPGEHILARLNETGDAQVRWTQNDQTSVEIARKAFAQGKKDGMMIYRVDDATGLRGAILHEFDPAAERIIIGPPLRGGSR